MRSSAGKPPKPKKPQGGYALVLMLALLIAGSIYTILHYLDAAGTATSQTSTTARALMQARDALLGYAATYRESHADEGFGYLPCPDTDGDGIAETTCNNAVSLGLLPYRTLGLPDLRDASGTCLWYAVTARFRNNPKSDPLNWDSQGLISIADASGSKMLQAADDSKGGTAAVIFAAGPPLGAQASGRNRIGTPCAIDPAQANLYLEYTTSPFRQGPGLDASSAIVLNDQLLWLSSAEIFTRIRSRSDFPTYLNAGIRGIQSALSFSLPAPATGNTLPTSVPPSLSQSDMRFYLQWGDQFRYLRCGTTGSYCYQLGSMKCDGVLLFSGEGVNGQPRPSSAVALANLLESSTLDLALGNRTTLTAAEVKTQYSGANRSQDLALCLSPLSQGGDMLPNTSSAPPTAVTNEVTTSPANAATPTSSPVARYITSSGPAVLQLGETGATDTAYGCLWYPDPLQLGTANNLQAGETRTLVNLRSYFAFTIDTVGHGFTLTLADADSSTNPSTVMCGKGGASLGYAGSNGVTPPINYPKMGLEFDTHKDTTFGDTVGSHIAMVYSGAAGLNDDNTHGAGNLSANPPYAINPTGIDGYSTYPVVAGKQYHVRLEMRRDYTAGSNSAKDKVSHTLRVYVLDSLKACSNFDNLSADLASFATTTPTPNCQIPPSINTVVSFSRKLICPSAADTSCPEPQTDDPIPFKQIWMGFTSGQDSITQKIFIQKFQLQITP